MRTIVFAVAAVTLLMSCSLILEDLTASVSAQQAGVSKQQLLDVNYSGPVFQDVFWTDRTTLLPAEGTSLDKVEVAPGDGVSILEVVLVNRGLSEITSVTGTLDLPSGFNAATTSSNQAVAKQNNIVEPGQPFTLFFEINVSRDAKAGEYATQLHVQYSRVLEVGQYRNVDITVPFLLTGKVVLDAEAVSRELVAGSADQVPILISNRGTAPATAVVVKVASATSSTAIASNGSTTVSAVTIGQNAFDVGSIPANGSAQIRPVIYASNSASQIPQSINLQVSYGNAYGVRTSTDIQVGLVVLPRNLESEISVSSSSSSNGSSAILTAGKIYPYNFTLSNTSGKSLSNVLITLTSASDSIKILGGSKWTVKSMDSGYSKVFQTEVFAPTSLIGESTTFNLNLQYISQGQTKTDSATMGAYIDGEISIRAYDIDLNYIGDTANIVGNLLNEGNTKALFTTIQLISAGGLTSDLPPPQYLGDLEENSPIPFSIPVDVISGTGAGIYPASLKVIYKDNLRGIHIVEINTQIKFEPKQPATQSHSTTINPVITTGIGIGLAAAATAIIIAIVLIRRKKESILKRTITEGKHNDTNNNNIESLLDSQQHLKTDERK